MYVDDNIDLNFFETDNVELLKKQLNLYEMMKRINVDSFAVSDNITLDCGECIRYIKIKILRLERKKKLKNIFENENL
jgi:hypothetical protein